jgi:recombination DNA repair RAD52 pathway protein
MAFSDSQLRRLRAPVQRKNIKEREIDGKTLHYLEGWHVVSEANRLFGLGGRYPLLTRRKQ